MATAYILHTDNNLRGKASWLENTNKHTAHYIFDRMSKIEKAFLNYALKCRADNPMRPIFFGYRQLAQDLGCAQYSIFRAIQRLVSKGLISIINHSYNGNQYRVHPLFDDIKFRSWLGIFLDALRKTVVFACLSLSMLSSPSSIIQTATVQPILDSDIFNNRSVTVSNSVCNTTCGRATSDGRVFQKNKKRVSEVMNQDSLNYIESSLNIITLTAWGKKNIACFPVVAIEFAQTKMKTTHGTVRDGYALFKSFCLQYCKSNNIRVDFSMVDSIKRDNPEVSQLGFYIPKTAVDNESQPDYNRPVSDHSPRHVFKAPTRTEESNLDTERPKIKQIIEEQKTIGTKPNYFLQQILGEVVYRDNKPIDVYPESNSSMFKKPSFIVPKPQNEKVEPVVPVVDMFVPLGAESMELVNKILDNQEVLGNSRESRFVLEQIGELMTKGASHFLAKDESFWQGMRFAAGIIDSKTGIDVQMRLG